MNSVMAQEELRPLLHDSDSASVAESWLTEETSSTVLGPGAITGRFLKAIGGKSLDLVVSLVIRRRLVVIKQTLNKTPHVLRNPQGPSEWQLMNAAHRDLKELCRDEYSQSLRRTAAKLIWDITVLTRAMGPDPTFIDGEQHQPSESSLSIPDEASPTNGQWEALLACIRLEPRDAPSETGYTNVGSSLGTLEGLKGQSDNKNRTHTPDPTLPRRKPRPYSPTPLRAETPQILHAPNPSVQKPPERKVLVLGAARVGKSTVFKQLQAIQEHLAPDYYDETIFNNLIHEIAIVLKDVGHVPAAGKAYVEAKKFFEFKSISWARFSNDPQNAQVSSALHTLGTQFQVRQSVRRMREEGLLSDSSEYFFNAVSRICVPDYIPTREDIMRVRIRTAGMSSTKLDMESSRWDLWDTGGERVERKKWKHCFGETTAVLFVVALPDYNRRLYERPDVNAMHESLCLFESIVNSPWFTNTVIILLFNKVDIFEEQLKISLLKDWMLGYEGNNTFEDARDFVKQEFINLVKDKRKPLPVHFISAVDATAMSDLSKEIQDEIDLYCAL